MKQRTQRIMEQYKLTDKIESLTNDLLSIRYAVGVEFDLGCIIRKRGTKNENT